MRYVFLLKRDKSDDRAVYRMTSKEALDYLSAEGFCNPHQLVCDLRRAGLRKAFFARYLSECEVYMVNTTCSAEETQENIRGVLEGRCGI